MTIVNKVETNQNNINSCILKKIQKSAFKIEDTKEFGCNRCAYCSARIANIIHSSNYNYFYGKAPTIVDLIYCANFPHVLIIILKYALNRAIRKRKYAEELAANISALSENIHKYENIEGSDEFYKNKRYLKLARIAAAFECVLEIFKDTFEDYPILNKGVLSNIESIIIKAHCVSFNLCHEEDKYFYENRFYNDEDDINKIIKGEKRICSGGLLFNNSLKNGKLLNKLIIRDFSINHFLALIKNDILEEKSIKFKFNPNDSLEKYYYKDKIFEYNIIGEYLPSQRELPFKIFAKIKHRKGNDVSAQTLHERDLGSLGNKYQLFEIIKIEPLYYYLALCAASTSKRMDLRDCRCVNMYDLPEPPIKHIILKKDQLLKN